MTTATAEKEKTLRTLDLRVRLTGQEKILVRDMMHEDLMPTESSFIRLLIFAEARRRGKLDAVESRKASRS